MTGAELRAARLALGIGTPTFGRRLGVNPRTVRKWEAGKFPVPRMAEIVVEMWQDEAKRKTPA